VPKAILEFSLPEEEVEYSLARWGVELHVAITSMDNWLRHKEKHEDKEMVSVREAREKLAELCDGLPVW